MNSLLGHRLCKHWLLLLLTLLCASSSGCVRRRLTLRTSPPGALAYVDGQFIGATPVSTDFTYYGTRKIELVKDGFETQTVKQQFLPPWYQWPGLDFVFENLNPYEMRDERELHFALEAQRIVPAGELLGRADYLRNGSRQGVVTPLPQNYPGGGGSAWGAGVVAPGSNPVNGPPPASNPPPAAWVGPATQELGPDRSTDRFLAPPQGATILPPAGASTAPFSLAPSELNSSPDAGRPSTAPDVGLPPSQFVPPAGAWPGFGPSGERIRPGEGARDFY